SGNLAIEGTLSDISQNSLTIDDNANLTTGNVYQINGTSVLSATTLGTGVVTSSLTTVGALASGSIATGFGTILTTNTIQGSDITASGTTGFIATGSGAGLTFSGTGNHDIASTAGTLRIGGFSLLGSITGNAQNITGLQDLSASGSVTFSNFTSNGGPLYTNTSGQLAQTTAGTIHQVLHGGATPFFAPVDLGSDTTGELSINQGGSPFNEANGAIFERNTTQDFLLGGQSTASAKFAILNVNSGTTTASLSGTTGGIYLTANGTIATTDKQSLVIGDTNTGNIVLTNLGTGIIHSVNGVLSSSAINLASGDVSGILQIANGGTHGNATPNSGDISYGTGTAYAFSLAGSTGPALVSGGTG